MTTWRAFRRSFIHEFCRPSPLWVMYAWLGVVLGVVLLVAAGATWWALLSTTWCSFWAIAETLYWALGGEDK